MRATPEVSCLQVFAAAGRGWIECSNPQAEYMLYLKYSTLLQLISD
jgi:hypothetical protein